MAEVLGNLLKVLNNNLSASIRFILPNYEFVESHFHVTEIGRVKKDFISCGGTYYSEESCVLQLWVWKDEDHRVNSEKLLKIFKSSERLDLSESLELRVQYGLEAGVVYRVSSIREGSGIVDIVLSNIKTNCLEPEKCGINLSVKECCNNRCC